MKSYATLLFSIFFLTTSCIKQEASEFNQTQAPQKGEQDSVSTPMNIPMEFTYTIDQKDKIDSAIVITQEPQYGNLLNCDYNGSNSISCTYFPNKDFFGKDKVSFKAKYGDFESEESDLIIEVTQVIEKVTYPPIAGADQTYLSEVNKEIYITVNQATDKDTLDLETLTYELVDSPKNGTLTNCFQSSGSKTCTYMPNTNFVGKDSLTYKVIDLDGNSSNLATINIETQLNCKNVTRLGIYKDLNGNDIADKEESLGQISSYTGSENAAANYNYYSASAHPKIGPKPSSYAGNVFLYDGSDGLSLNMFFNVDEGGSDYNKVVWEVYTSNNNSSDAVLLSDDNMELKKLDSEVAENHSQTYKGVWQYWKNTDGGVIGPFLGNNFEIKVKMIEKGDVNDVKFHSANAEDDVFLLSDKDEVNTTFFIKFYDQEVCGYE